MPEADTLKKIRKEIDFSGEQLLRIEVAGGKVISQEVLFKDLGRIRHVITGPDGALYVLLPKRIVRLTPAP